MFKSQEEKTSESTVANATSTKDMIIPSKVLSFIQLSPLIDPIGVQKIGSESNKTTSLVSYLKNNTLPASKESVRKLKVQAA